jgi:hypothetical protein
MRQEAQGTSKLPTLLAYLSFAVSALAIGALPIVGDWVLGPLCKSGRLRMPSVMDTD